MMEVYLSISSGAFHGVHHIFIQNCVEAKPLEPLHWNCAWTNGSLCATYPLYPPTDNLSPVTTMHSMGQTSPTICHHRAWHGSAITDNLPPQCMTRGQPSQTICHHRAWHGSTITDIFSLIRNLDSNHQPQSKRKEENLMEHKSF